MRVLIACEFSGTVRDAFIRRGHDAMSCDLLPTETEGPHFQGDVADVFAHIDGRKRILGAPEWLRQGIDLMIAHPPCTHLAVSGARHFARKRADGSQDAALAFVASLMTAPVSRICVENPVSIISTRIRKPDQIIQPWQYGHGETKTTCLWLKCLPALKPTDIVVPEWAVNPDGTVNFSAKGKRDNPTHFLTGRIRVLKGAQREQWERIHRMPPSPDRWRIRSKTYTGIAEAMAEQWGAQ